MRVAKKILIQFVTISMVLSASGVSGLAGPSSTRSARPGPALTGADDVFALPEAKAGAPYEYQIQAEGGLAPLVWKVAQGELPPGIRLEATGKLAGAPPRAMREAYRFDIEVSDSSQPPQKFSQAFLLMVKAAPLRIVTNRPALRIIDPGLNQPSAAGPQAATDANGNGQEVSLTARTLSAAPDSTGVSSTLVASTAGSPAAMSPIAPNPSAPAAAPSASMPGAPTLAATPTPTPTPCPTPTPKPTPTSSPTPTPTPCPENCKITICGRLRPASIDQTMSLIRNLPSIASALEAMEARSEERRVGKECRSRW